MPRTGTLDAETDATLRVLIAPDSFKGTVTAAGAADALAAAWTDERPADLVTTLPLADGGEGTVAALATAQPRDTGGHLREARVHDLRGNVVTVAWLELPDGGAVVDLASCCGLPQLRVPDPLGADTRPLGELLRAVCDTGARRVTLGLGGSASTDAGTGALRALGLRLLDSMGRDLPRGGGALTGLARIVTDELVAPPSGGIDLLVDVTNPLCGPTGAAAVFGPQKGASPRDVALLEEAMVRVREVVGVPDGPGAGAAGGTAYGLAALWGGRIVPGADRVLEIAGFDDALAGADLVITGEGRFDHQSLGGKLVGTVLARARRAGVPAVVVAGAVDPSAPAGVDAVSLSELAGSSLAARSEPSRWLLRAGAELARSYRGACPA